MDFQVGESPGHLQKRYAPKLKKGRKGVNWPNLVFVL